MLGVKLRAVIAMGLRLLLVGGNDSIRPMSFYSLRKTTVLLKWSFTVTDMNDGGRVLDACAHAMSRDFVSQSASESWCITYSVTSSVKQMSFIYFYLCMIRLRVHQHSQLKYE
jgi:hypothetical protein